MERYDRRLGDTGEHVGLELEARRSLCARIIISRVDVCTCMSKMYRMDGF